MMASPHRGMKRERFTKVGSYILTHSIAVGSTGSVRICIHRNSLFHYACKIIERKFIRERINSLQVRREIAVMRRLRHPNVVSLVAVHTTLAKVFIIMELIEGGELFDQVQKLNKMTEEHTRFYFQQLMKGLRHCHEKGVYHRDLKLENLLIDKQRTLKITDFGMSKLRAVEDCGVDNDAHQSILLHTQCGTPNYVAPEIINRGGYSGSKVDMWSCGVILFVLASGYLPFESDNLSVLFKRIVRCNVNYPAHFSPDLRDLVSNLLKINPTERYSISEVEQHPWFTGPIERHTNGGVPLKTPVARWGRHIFGVIPRGPAPAEGDIEENGPAFNCGNMSEMYLKRRGSNDSSESLNDASETSEVALRSLPAVVQEAIRATLILEPESKQESPALMKNNGPDITGRTEGNRDELNGEATDSEDGQMDPDKHWVLREPDRLAWCRLMREFDMIPDELEFGENSAKLCDMWQGGLAKENLQRKTSFALGRFGQQKKPSRSTQYLISAAQRAELQRPAMNGVSAQFRTIQSSEGGGLPSTGAVKVERQTVSDLNNRETMAATIPGKGDADDNRILERATDIPYDMNAPVLDPDTVFLPPIDDHVLAIGSSSGHPVENPTGSPTSALKMGEGQDLLEENDDNDLDEPNGIDSDDPNEAVPINPGSDLNGLPYGLTENQQSPTNGFSPGPNANPAPLTKFAPGFFGPNGGSLVLSPFALDLPGPQRTPPVTKTLLTSIVPSKISPKRFRRKSPSALDTRSATQFYSLLDPSECFEVIQSVLQKEGCNIIKASSLRSRQRFRIRCESARDEGTVQARLSIYKVDDNLATIRFKRLPLTDVNNFTKFYLDISRAYAETINQNGSQKDPPGNELLSNRKSQVRFENTANTESTGAESNEAG